VQTSSEQPATLTSWLKKGQNAQPAQQPQQQQQQQQQQQPPVTMSDDDHVQMNHSTPALQQPAALQPVPRPGLLTSLYHSQNKLGDMKLSRGPMKRGLGGLGGLNSLQLMSQYKQASTPISYPPQHQQQHNPHSHDFGLTTDLPSKDPNLFLQPVASHPVGYDDSRSGSQLGGSQVTEQQNPNLPQGSSTPNPNPLSNRFQHLGVTTAISRFANNLNNLNQFAPNKLASMPQATSYNPSQLSIVQQQQLQQQQQQQQPPFQQQFPQQQHFQPYQQSQYPFHPQAPPQAQTPFAMNQPYSMTSPHPDSFQPNLNPHQQYNPHVPSSMGQFDQFDQSALHFDPPPNQFGNPYQQQSYQQPLQHQQQQLYQMHQPASDLQFQPYQAYNPQNQQQFTPMYDNPGPQFPGQQQHQQQQHQQHQQPDYSLYSHNLSAPQYPHQPQQHIPSSMNPQFHNADSFHPF
jgi:hypothetical protein